MPRQPILFRSAEAALSAFHLWNLDAPTIAVLWQLLFAHSFRVAIGHAVTIALAVSVWLIYAADRLLDVMNVSTVWLTRRHAFHLRHRRQILALSCAGTATLAFVVTLLRPLVLECGILVAGVVIFYFLCAHFFPENVRRHFPKEIAVGILFAVGCGLAPFCRAQRPDALILPVLFFGVLCSLNCVAVEVWEWRGYGQVLTKPSVLTLWLARHIRLLLLLLAGTAGALFLCSISRSVFAAIFVSACLFLLLDALRPRFSIDLLRMLVDIPLLSPLVLLVSAAAQPLFR